MSTRKKAFLGGRWPWHKYQLRRRELMKLVQPDGRCAVCQAKAPSWQALEFDHVDGRAWVLRQLSRDQRIRVMERERAQGVKLRGCCRRCNGSDGATRAYTTSQAKWSDPPRRAACWRRGQAEFYQAQRIQEFNRRWLAAAELWAEVQGVLESSDARQAS